MEKHLSFSRSAVSVGARKNAHHNHTTNLRVSIEHKLRLIQLESKEPNLVDLVEYIRDNVDTTRPFNPWYATITREKEDEGAMQIKFYLRGRQLRPEPDLHAFILEDGDTVYFGDGSF